jgi:hypothetical protein
MSDNLVALKEKLHEDIKDTNVRTIETRTSQPIRFFGGSRLSTAHLTKNR